MISHRPCPQSPPAWLLPLLPPRRLLRLGPRRPPCRHHPPAARPLLPLLQRRPLRHMAARRGRAAASQAVGPHQLRRRLLEGLRRHLPVHLERGAALRWLRCIKYGELAPRSQRAPCENGGIPPWACPALGASGPPGPPQHPPRLSLVGAVGMAWHDTVNPTTSPPRPSSPLPSSISLLHSSLPPFPLLQPFFPSTAWFQHVIASSAFGFWSVVNFL